MSGETNLALLSYKATGTPTSRTHGDRAAEARSILDFGADPTGVADSQPAFAAAITAVSNNGRISIPKGAYKLLSGVSIPHNASLQFVGESNGSFVSGNFNGFLLDNLSDPYTPSANVSIEGLNLSNSFIGNCFSVTANDTWTASGSPQDITLSGANPGVEAGAALWSPGSGGLSTNSVFIGMITDVSSWPTVTVASTAVASGANSALALKILQCYPAGGSWNGAGSGTISSYTYNSGTGLVTLTLSAPATLSTNNAINVSGLNIAGLNGAFTVAAPVSSSTTVTYTAATGQGGSPSGGGSISWSGAAQITMAATRPAGIGDGTYYVYNYEYYLSDPKSDFIIGTATWANSTTVTFVPGTGGVIGNSVGSADRLWFAPAAGCIRLSSTTIGQVKNCAISGFHGLTSSQDGLVPDDPTEGAAEAFHIVAESCNFSNPSGFSGLMGQTNLCFQNNSISINSNHNSAWCGERFSGTTCGSIGGRAEVCHFGTILGGNNTANINSLSLGFIYGRSMESNLVGIYAKSASASIKDTGAICNALASTIIAGFYFNSFSGVVENSGCIGNFGSSAYAIYIEDAGSGRGLIKFLSVTGLNQLDSTKNWRIPAQAWWGDIDQKTCSGLPTGAQVYTFANLPDGTGSPDPFEGEEHNISDGTNSLGWGDVCTNTGTHTTHYKVRYNGTNWTVVGK